MRAVSFVKRLQWELPGTVCRHGLTIGDVDNDGDNELVVGTAEGDLFIFKGLELWQKITGLGLITSVAIGDIFNYGRNALVVICGDGWAHIFYSPKSVSVPPTQPTNKDSTAQDNLKIGAGHNFFDLNTCHNTSTLSPDQVDDINEVNELSGKMECVHIQRIPTNTKIVLVADIDQDGANEMIIGLTDRVVRSYRWSSNADLGTGKLIGLNKWECANQIGTVTLQHNADGTPALLVAQPGGTFMRIKCNREDSHTENESCDSRSEAAASCVDYQTLGISRMRNQNISTEIIGNLESGELPSVTMLESKITQRESTTKEGFMNDSHIGLKNLESMFPEFKGDYSQAEISDPSRSTNHEGDEAGFMRNQRLMRFYSATESSGIDQVDGNFLGGNVILEELNVKDEKDSLLPMFKHFSCNDNNNDDSNNNKNESNIQGDSDANSKGSLGKTDGSKGKPYALATLDGTIMLVKDEIILWAIQVDHQVFALCQLDVTGDGSDEIIACAWDGHTYILDQQRNSVRFQFEEPVNAFCTGKYSVNPGTLTPCFIYNTFNNKILLYYDVMLPSMTIKSLNPMEFLDAGERKKLDDMLDAGNEVERRQKVQQLTEWLLYEMH